MTSNTKLLTRRAAAERVREKFGIPCAESTLAKRASEGTGPTYRIVAGRALYAEADVDAWAPSLIGPPIRRAADATAPARAA
jgi:hypothetical protein